MIIAKNCRPEENPIIMEVLSETPEEAAASRKQWEQLGRNRAWLEERIAEIVRKYPGSVICVADGELFAGNDDVEVVERAKAAHPDEMGYYVRYIPKAYN